MRNKLIYPLAILLLVLSLGVGCSSGDPVTENVYFTDIYGDDATFNTITVGGVTIGGIGGYYGLNVEALAGDVTLVPGTDEIYQWLSCAANRDVTLDTASASTGDRFVIRNINAFDSAFYLTVKEGVNDVEDIYAGTCKTFIYDGTNWRGIDGGSASEVADSIGNTVYGHEAIGVDRGCAFGDDADAQTHSVAFGYQANADTYAAAFGYQAYADNYGTAVGYSPDTNDQYYSVALGHSSETMRYGEMGRSLDGSNQQYAHATEVGLECRTTNNNPEEMFCGGVNNQRLTVMEESALGFSVRVVARDNTANEVAMYIMENGLIIRDGANNTQLVFGATVTVYEDDANWDCVIAADNVNEALIITVTGDAVNTVRWSAVVSGVETIF